MRNTPFAGACAVASKLRHAVVDLQIAHSRSTVGRHLTASIGGATTIPQRGTSFVELVDVADKALYQAKRSGKNREVIYEDCHRWESRPGASAVDSNPEPFTKDARAA